MEPAWTIRYLRTEANGDAGSEDHNGNKIDARQDWQVQLAREVLLAAPGYRRPDVLSAAGPVVQRHVVQEQQRIAAAFAKLGLDWTAGPVPAAPHLSAHLDLGSDDQIVVGQPEDVGLVVTNQGTQPVFQLSAVTTSDNPYLDHREFYFGRVDPGQTREVTARVDLQDGYPTEVAQAKIQLRTPDNEDLADLDAMVHTQGRALPAFSYQVALFDDGSGDSHGNGDGIPQVGETIDLALTIENVGKGPTSEAFARLKDEAGRALDLKVGNLDVGAPLDAAGKPCTPAEDTKPEGGGDAGCRRVLQPGQSWTGRMSFVLKEAPEDGHWDVDLQVGDSAAYDFASIQRGGFYDYFQLEETLSLSPDQVYQLGRRVPPQIDVTRAPGEESDEPSAVVSGLVTDDEGLRDVMIFHGKDKVFYRGGGGGGTSLPFSVERELQPGSNLVVILARDSLGLTATHAVETWYQPPPELQARTDTPPPG